MTERYEPVFYARVQPAGAPRNTWHRLLLTGRVLSFSYVDDEEKADTLELTLDNYGLEHFDEPVWRTGNYIEISWGYPGLMAPPRRVVIRKVTGFQQLKVQADGLEVLAQREPKFRVFNHMKRSDAVRAVAVELGYTDGRVQYIQDTEEVLEQITQPNITDAQFLRRMAEKEGFLWFIDHRGFHFHQRNLKQDSLRVLDFFNLNPSDQARVISVNMDDDVTAKKGRTKVRGRSPKEKKDVTAEESDDKPADVDLSDTVVAVVENVIDPSTGKRVAVGRSVWIDAPSNEGPTVANAQAGSGYIEGEEPGYPDPSLEPGQPLPYIPGETTPSGEAVPRTLPAAAWPAMEEQGPPEAKRYEAYTPLNPGSNKGDGATSEETEKGAKKDAKKRHRRNKQKALKLKIQVVGDPTWVAKSVYQLRNVGKKLSQLWYVRRATHSLTSSGFVVDVESTADGAGGIKPRSTIAPGLTSIQVRAKKKRKKTPKPEPKERARTGEFERDPETGGLVLHFEKTPEPSPLFVPIPGHDYSDPEEFGKPPPPVLGPTEGAGGAGGGGPPPDDYEPGQPLPSGTPREPIGGGGGTGGTGGGGTGGV